MEVKEEHLEVEKEVALEELEVVDLVAVLEVVLVEA